MQAALADPPRRLWMREARETLALTGPLALTQPAAVAARSHPVRAAGLAAGSRSECGR
jgi:hypothetical protein